MAKTNAAKTALPAAIIHSLSSSIPERQWSTSPIGQARSNVHIRRVRENGGTDLCRGRRGAPRDAGAPGCVASGAAGVVAVVGARRGEARSRRVTEAKEVEKGIS